MGSMSTKKSMLFNILENHNHVTIKTKLECQLQNNTDLPSEGLQPQPVAHEGFWGVDLRQRKWPPPRLSVPRCTQNNVKISKILHNTVFYTAKIKLPIFVIVTFEEITMQKVT